MGIPRKMDTESNIAFWKAVDRAAERVEKIAREAPPTGRHRRPAPASPEAREGTSKRTNNTKE
jgi:hypothetical protein